MDEPFKEFGEEGFDALVAAFYRRLREDDVVGAMYPRRDEERMRHAQIRLRDFLCDRFGGSKGLFEGEGKPYLGIRHRWMTISTREGDRWLELMQAAMDEVGLAGPARRRLNDFFTDTANALVTHREDHAITPSEFVSPGKRFDQVKDEEL